MTCRDEVLAAFESLERRHGRIDFSPSEIIQEMISKGTFYPDYTIRTEIVSRMCAQAPTHHAVTYDDLDRVRRGVYRRAVHRGSRRR